MFLPIFRYGPPDVRVEIERSAAIFLNSMLGVVELESTRLLMSFHLSKKLHRLGRFRNR